MPGRPQKLELRWAHKDKRLLYDYDASGELKPRFTELGSPEPRVLIDVGIRT